MEAKRTDGEDGDSGSGSESEDESEREGSWRMRTLKDVA